MEPQPSTSIAVDFGYNQATQFLTFTTLQPMPPSDPSSITLTDLSGPSSVPGESPPPRPGHGEEEVEEDAEARMDVADPTGDTGEPCLICGGVAKGLHFQVNSCRACATFFRRSTKGKLMYRCQRGTGRCDLRIKIKGKPLCRYCRMKKCVSVGMRIDSDTVPAVSTTTPHGAIPTTHAIVSEATSTATETPAPSTSWNNYFERADVRVEGKRIIYDTTPIVTRVKASLGVNRVASIQAPLGIALTTMQRMSHVVTKMLNELTPNVGDVRIIHEFGLGHGMLFLEKYILRLTEIVTTCEYFVNLNPNDKFALFRKFWTNFYSIERAYQTMLVFGCETNDFRLLFNGNAAIDMDSDIEHAMPDLPNGKQLLKIFEPFKDLMFVHLVNPLKALRPTAFEVAYMAVHCLWSCWDIRDLAPETYKMSEEVIDRIGNDVHSYYVYEQHTPNYASRHAALLKIVSVSEFLGRSKKDMMLMAKVFDICQDDFYESELC